MRMRIGIHALFLRPGRIGGVETYIRGLLPALEQADQQNDYRIYVTQQAAPSLRFASARFQVVPCLVPGTSRIARIVWEQAILPRWLARDGIDLLHCLSSVVPLPTPVPTLATVHYVQTRDYLRSQSLLRALYLKLLVPPSYRKACRVIAISHTIRQSLLARAHMNPEKVAVVYYGIDDSFRQATPDPVVQACYGLTTATILYPAVTAPSKNHILLLHAFQRLKLRTGLPHKLVLAGIRGAAHRTVLQTIAELGLTQEVRWLGTVPLTAMPQLYLAADLVVLPSQSEGFGFPVVEAMTCGRPVLAANTTAIPEIAGDAALLIDPHDPDAWCTAMHRLLTDTTLRATLVARGRARARAFCWQTAARQMLQVYAQALGCSPGGEPAAKGID